MKNFENYSQLSNEDNNFEIIVNITNNRANDEIGEITVALENKTKTISIPNIIMPAKATITKTFVFDSNDVPVGKAFNVDGTHVKYGNEDELEAEQEQVHGINDPLSGPEEVQIYLGDSCSYTTASSDPIFHLNVQVINNERTDQQGFIATTINSTNIDIASTKMMFPKNETITIPFECDLRYVPVGKGYSVKLVLQDNNTQIERKKYGINNITDESKIMSFVLTPEKFLVNIQISNMNNKGTYGYIFIDTEDNSILLTSSRLPLPANSTMTKPFMFDK